MRKLFRLFLLTILLVQMSRLIDSSAARGSQQKQQQQTVDDDEFSEFDSIEDEDVAGKKTPPKPAAATSAESKHKDDFAGFDEASVSNEDDEFESFGDAAETKKQTQQQKQQQQQAKKIKVEQKTDTGAGAGNKKKPPQSTFNDDLDQEEFEHLVDDEEFEGFESGKKEATKPSSSGGGGVGGGQTAGDNGNKAGGKKLDQSGGGMPNLKIASVPVHLMSSGNWQNYIWEICMIVIIAVYFSNFVYGRAKNYRLVHAWYQSHRDLLERNFSVVGDDGNSTDPQAVKQEPGGEIGNGILIKESENSYGLWCTGRHGCDGMLIQLKLVKRQDLINGVIMQAIKPKPDQIMLSVEFAAPDDIDNFVFCLTNRKCSQQLFNDYLDLSTYCTEKRTVPTSGGNGADRASHSAMTSSSFGGDYKYADLLQAQVGARYTMLNEFGEVPNFVLDMRVCAFLNKYPEMIEYLIISDQYVGFRSSQTSEDQSQPPTGSATPTTSDSTSATIGLSKSRPILILCLNVPGKGSHTGAQDMEKMQPAFQLAMYLADRVPRIRLSKEVKAKAVKKRKEVNEQCMKLTHKQRQEAAMLRKEEKRRAEKEKIMNESDPEKQRKLEEKEQRREKKKSLSKMKQVKIKSM